MIIASSTAPSRVFTCTNSGLEMFRLRISGASLASTTRTLLPSLRRSDVEGGVETSENVSRYDVNDGLKLALCCPGASERRLSRLPPNWTRQPPVPWRERPVRQEE